MEKSLWEFKSGLTGDDAVVNQYNVVYENKSYYYCRRNGSDKLLEIAKEEVDFSDSKYHTKRNKKVVRDYNLLKYRIETLNKENEKYYSVIDSFTQDISTYKMLVENNNRQIKLIEAILSEADKIPQGGKIQTNKYGTNTAIKFHLRPEEYMRYNRFTDRHEDTWYYMEDLGHDITFDITVNKSNSDDFHIDVIDDAFGQPYDYQYILNKNPNNTIAKEIKEKVEVIMARMEKLGFISGHKYGEYI